jgi:hypothetical protein
MMSLQHPDSSSGKAVFDPKLVKNGFYTEGSYFECNVLCMVRDVQIPQCRNVETRHVLPLRPTFQTIKIYIKY